MSTQSELEILVAEPAESLFREYKSWLRLTDNSHRAILAKAAIALANHGGGVVVLGMRAESGADLVSTQRPADLGRYDQDLINAAINRFADPQIHCELAFVAHPETNVEHAIVVVPRGPSTPVMSKRDCQGVISAQRCYIRKPGPRSEEPFTSEEWRALLDRCVRDGRETMLDAIRNILQGQVGSPPTEDASERLMAFAERARGRWQERIETLPVGDSARLTHGHYELTFVLQDVLPAPNLRELRQRLTEAGNIRLTGWGPFIDFGRPPIGPEIIDDLIEAWIGAREDGHNSMRTPAHCDFWRADRAGRLFLLRGFDEDGMDRVAPGTVLDVTLPVWRVGEAMLFVSRLGLLFDEDPMVTIHARYTGLSGRTLDSVQNRRWVRSNGPCQDNEVVLETQARAAEIDQNLAEVLHPFLSPLYERFAFHELRMELVLEELQEMRRNRF